MPELKLRQLQYETDTWKRLLVFMMDENIHLKIRLSEVLNNKFNESMLEQVENFHNDFLKEDDLIGLLRNEVAEIEMLLDKEMDGEISFKKAESKIKKLRNNLLVAENQFSKLKLEFYSYLSENI